MPTYRMPVTISSPYLPDLAVNVWHFRADAEADLDGSFGDAVASLHTLYRELAGIDPNPSPLFPQGTRIQADSAVDVADDSTHPVDFAPIVSATNPNMLQPQAALVVNWKTTSSSRRGTGRTFLGPLIGPTIDMTNGTVRDESLNYVRRSVTDFISRSTAPASGATGWAFGVYGLQNGGGTADSPHVLRDIVGHKINDRFGWLRSRGR